MHFTKMQGTGNDFIVVEEHEVENINLTIKSKFLCDRHFGIGADGVLLLKKKPDSNYEMVMYNPDGSEAMCGNGLRCFAKYLYLKGYVTEKHIKIDTIAGCKDIVFDISNNNVSSIMLNMGYPIFEREKIPMSTQGEEPVLYEIIKVLDKTFSCAVLSMGNPHCVIFLEDLTSFDVAKYGSAIEVMDIFPERTNVEFVEVVSKEEINMRVWERGAGITLSCGTGTCASVVAGIERDILKNDVKVNVLGGELEVKYKIGEQVHLKGPAELVFEGDLNLHHIV